jgi:hypothetical protein
VGKRKVQSYLGGKKDLGFFEDEFDIPVVWNTYRMKKLPQPPFR